MSFLFSKLYHSKGRHCVLFMWHNPLGASLSVCRAEEVSYRIFTKKGLRNLAVGAGRTWVTLFKVLFPWFHVGCLSGFHILVGIVRVMKTRRCLSTASADKHTVHK